MSNNPVIIIGSGMAGYTLARELRKLNADIAITLVCRDAGESYAKPTLSNALAQGKLADSIALSDAIKMAKALNLTVYNFYNVSHIDSDQKTLTIHPILASDKQQILPYNKLVLATGAHARQLPHVPVDHKTVFSINHLDDYRKFQQLFHEKLKQTLANKQNKTTQPNNTLPPLKIAIIGAGLIGCEFANDILTHTATLAEVSESLDLMVNPATTINLVEKTSLPLTVTLIDKAPYPMANQLPKLAGDALQTALEGVGANFMLGADIVSVENQASEDSENRVSQITINNADGEKVAIQADMVLVATGLVANTELAEQTGLAVAHLSSALATVKEIPTHLPRTAQQGILVDKFLQTSQPDIYAIGDCANVMGSFMPYVMPLMTQAKTLAKTLADNFINNDLPATPIKYPAMPVAIKTPSCPLVLLPVSARYAENDIVWENQPTDDGMMLLAKEKANVEQLLGFVLVGKVAGKQRMTLAKQVSDWL